MKYLVLLCDGMADRPVPELGNRTPMEAAKKPHMDALAAKSEIGLVKTVADGLKPGSDVANLSVMGYDPAECYTGRSPLEAASIGVPIGADDLTLRCNLVTLSDEEDYEARTMLDYSGRDISTPEAGILMARLQEALGTDEFVFYPGVAYRHCLLWKNGKQYLEAIKPLTPPHDITDQPIRGKLPNLRAAKQLGEIMRKSADILRGEKANSAWLWGEGTKPALQSFYTKTGLKGTVISAVDLLKGIAKLSGMDAPEVEGATAYLDTNFEGKADAAIAAWESGQDLVYLHIEAPDECGHRAEAENKVTAIELIDSRVLPQLLAYLEKQEPYRVLILPDHATPLALKTHTSEPVPYLLYKSDAPHASIAAFTEATAASTGVYIPHGPDLIKKLIA
ncbi:MAG: cofactor-independent phosphoglycerate mutase [Oscillospiraceae bacterium]|nr:cofactor-independent phosphoglycerate mutase [Oscillospiraceae bacterium]